MRTAVVALLVASVLAGCKVTSIDSVKNKQLDLCAKIADQQIREQCIVGVK